jgi:hypothetical protein
MMPGMCSAVDQWSVRKACFEMGAPVCDWEMMPVQGKGCLVYDGEL